MGTGRGRNGLDGMGPYLYAFLEPLRLSGWEPLNVQSEVLAWRGRSKGGGMRIHAMPWVRWPRSTESMDPRARASRLWQWGCTG